MVAGIYGSVVKSPSSCELHFVGFEGQFILWTFWLVVVLALGGIRFSGLVLAYRRLRD